jgi:SanA protein
MIIPAGIILFLFMLLSHILVRVRANKLVKELNDLPESFYALVLGAGLESDGRPTDILSDRVLSAVKLLDLRKAEKLIMSGSSNGGEYDEVAAMEKLAISTGVDQEKIILDKSGVSTLNSLINFKKRFKNESLVIVTQQFHLPRSLWLAKKLNLNCYGFPASIYRFSALKKFLWSSREFFALPFNLLKLFAYWFQEKNRPI